MGASKIKLGGKELKELDEAVRSADVYGERYAKSSMAGIVADTPPLK